MTDNELLLAISSMLDPIKEEVRDLKGEVQELKEDVQDIQEEVRDIKDRVKRIELTQENKILPRLNTIESCYTSTYDRYKDQTETYESMKQDVTIMKKVMVEHSEKLQKLA